MASIYELNGRVPVLQAVPFGLQHVLAMFVANITPIIILANVAGVNAELSAALIQNCMVIAGIGTLVQLYPVWRIGSRLPIVMGISFTFLSLAIAIATTQGMGTLVGAVIVGGLVEGCLGLFPKYWTRLIPQVVAATVVTAIGFSLLPIGANSFAGGQGAADFGSAHQLGHRIRDAPHLPPHSGLCPRFPPFALRPGRTGRGLHSLGLHGCGRF